MTIREDFKMIDFNTLSIWLKSWWISLSGGITSFISAWFGSGILLFIDPDMASTTAKVLTSFIGVAIAAVTLLYTLRRKRMQEMFELRKMKMEEGQDMELHSIGVLSAAIKLLEETGAFTPEHTYDDKIVIAKDYIKKLNNSENNH